MTSFDSSPQLNVWRALLALAVVFVMLATTGWTAIRSHREESPLQASLSSWQRGHLDGRELPDAESSPHRLAAFFASLTAYQRTRLAHRYPLAVGNMNGAPVELRYRANRIALKQQSDLEQERMHDQRLSETGRYEAGRRMHRLDMLAVKKRHILAFSPEGNGRVAEVFGSLDKAERVSVVVPGVDTNVINFQRTNRRYSAPVGMAEALYEAERSASPGTRTAVIAWADYTAPTGLGLDSATALRAEQGSVRLNALVRSLPGGSTVALVCHSYGSVVCGVAAPSLPSRVTDIAVAGSPGMRAETVGQLRTPARVWAMRDADDWIQDVPYLEVGGLGHGADPVSSEFGARILSAADAQGHSGYFEPGTESLYNFAEIGIGAYESVHCAREDDACLAGLSASTAA
ncbi:alpha/beta hydrolase [Streptomyces europaeiscabiei]|uniref:alpha/beta hydrolase n=1 Tax=Streptomyces europaeiscabiei TaxID=146819 RepID=UPI002E2D441F|nr:alpha/beta hydrolase [Streptomyces europaeiscabiei]